MFRAFGTILVLLTIVNIFAQATVALEQAFVATFNALEAAAVTATQELDQID